MTLTSIHSSESTQYLSARSRDSVLFEIDMFWVKVWRQKRIHPFHAPPVVLRLFNFPCTFTHSKGFSSYPYLLGRRHALSILSISPSPAPSRLRSLFQSSGQYFNKTTFTPYMRTCSLHIFILLIMLTRGYRRPMTDYNRRCDKGLRYLEALGSALCAVKPHSCARVSCLNAFGMYLCSQVSWASYSYPENIVHC